MKNVPAGESYPGPLDNKSSALPTGALHGQAGLPNDLKETAQFQHPLTCMMLTVVAQALKCEFFAICRSNVNTGKKQLLSCKFIWFWKKNSSLLHTCCVVIKLISIQMETSLHPAQKHD